MLNYMRPPLQFRDPPTGLRTTALKRYVHSQTILNDIPCDIIRDLALNNVARNFGHWKFIEFNEFQKF